MLAARKIADRAGDQKSRGKRVREHPLTRSLGEGPCGWRDLRGLCGACQAAGGCEREGCYVFLHGPSPDPTREASMSPHVRYIDKTRAYYEAEGYGKPYEWAHFDDIPFTPFAAVGKPLSECRVGVVTTSEMARQGSDIVPDDPKRLVYSLPTGIPVAELYSRKSAYDRYATTL